MIDYSFITVQVRNDIARLYIIFKILCGEIKYTTDENSWMTQGDSDKLKEISDKFNIIKL